MLFFVVKVIAFVCWLVAIVCLFSVGEIDHGNEGTQYKTVVWKQETRNMIAFMIIGVLWLMAFLIACSQFVIIVATCTWYFSHNADTKGNASIK